MSEALEGLLRLIEVVGFAWLLATIPAGLVLLYFGYYLFEILKFVVGFAVGGAVIGGLFYAGGGEAAAILGFVIGGIVSGLLFRALLNLVPVVLGAIVLGSLCFLYLQATQDMSTELMVAFSAMAAGAGAGLGHWLRIVLTVLGTAWAGMTLVLSSAFKIHVSMGDIGDRLLRGDAAGLGFLVTAYGLLGICLFLSGVVVQFQHMRRRERANQSKESTEDEESEASAPPAARAAPSRPEEVPGKAAQGEGIQDVRSSVQREGAAFLDRGLGCVLHGQIGNGAVFSKEIAGASLLEEGVVIGRNPHNATVVIEDDTLSRRHARLFAEGRAIFIEDLGSTNGTLVNGTRLNPGTRWAVSDGDRIEMGAVQIVFGRES